MFLNRDDRFFNLFKKSDDAFINDTYLPFLEEKKEDIERLKNIQLDLHADFIKVVEESRSTKLKKELGIELFTGEFWSGTKSKELGLIDGIGNA